MSGADLCGTYRGEIGWVGGCVVIWGEDIVTAEPNARTAQFMRAWKEQISGFGGVWRGRAILIGHYASQSFFSVVML